MSVQTREMETDFKPSDEISWKNYRGEVLFLTHGDFRKLETKIETLLETIERMEEVIDGVKEGEVTKENVEEVFGHMMGGDLDGYCPDCHEHTSAQPTIDLDYAGGCCGAGVRSYDG